MISFAHIANKMLSVGLPTAAEHTMYALAVQAVVRAASEAGLVVTVTQIAQLPLAMGHYGTLVEIRERAAR